MSEKLETKTIRMEADLYKRIVEVYNKDENFNTQQDLYKHLLWLGLERYYNGEKPFYEEHHEEDESFVDDRLSLEQLHTYILSFSKGDDSILYDIAPVSLLRIYQREKDNIEKDMDLDDQTREMNLLFLIARFGTRYAFLRYIFYNRQLEQFPMRRLALVDDKRYDFIYILDNAGDIPLWPEQEERIRFLFSIYKTIGTSFFSFPFSSDVDKKDDSIKKEDDYDI